MTFVRLKKITHHNCRNTKLLPTNFLFLFRFEETTMSIWILVVCFILFFPSAFLLYAFFQSALELERRATTRLGFLFLAWVIVIAVIVIWPEQVLRDNLLIGAALLIIAVAIVLLFPWPEKGWSWSRGKPDRIDERNIMFSRTELIPGSDRYNSYYQEFPEHKELDDHFRKYPGLLSAESSFYNPWLFGAADAAFFTVESLHPKTDGPVNKAKLDQDPEDVSNFIANWASELGCHSLGITTLQDHHLYHTGGRKHNYGEEVENSHAFAIAFTVEMDFQRVRSAPRGPIIMESSAQYLKSGTIAVQLAAFIRSVGYSARAHIDGKYQVRCPEVAKDAGLGELGRMSLLMTPNLGPRVRIGVVTTDMPLTVSQPRPDTSLLKFCRICKKCAETCPSQALSYDDPKEVGGTKQWVVNQEACFTYWCKIGTDCGRCISVCPYSHPDNLLHKVVRVLIKSSSLFRPFAVKMDNWLYGRKPPEKELPGWMK